VVSSIVGGVLVGGGKALTTSPIKLSVVIVNYNGGDLVETCVGSLYENPTRRAFEVIVVDNGSSDGSPDKIASAFPQVRLIRRDRNVGLAQAFNQGVAAMRGRYLLSLDDGSRVLPGAIDALVDFLDVHASAGAAGARSYDPDMTVQSVARRFPHPLNAIFGRRSIAAKLFPNSALVKNYLMTEFNDSKEPFEVDWNSSAALMVRRTAIEEVGGMDPRYFVYWVDADWCFRLRKAGWEIHCVPRSQVVHLENLRTGYRQRPKSKMILDFHIGAYRFYRNHYLQAWWTPMGLVSACGLATRATCLLVINGVWRLIGEFRAACGKPVAGRSR
jgi:GT2 family glycosyltransferase